MVSGQPAFIKVAVNNTKVSVIGNIIRIDTIIKWVLFIVSLRLGKRKSWTEVPPGTYFPGQLWAKTIGPYQVYIVPAVEMWVVMLKFKVVVFVIAVYKSVRVHNPAIKPLLVVLKGHIQPIGIPFFQDEIFILIINFVAIQNIPKPITDLYVFSLHLKILIKMYML